MCDFLTAAPQGRYAFYDGCSVIIGHGDHSHIGKGTVDQVDSLNFVAHGEYNIAGYNGTWKFSMTSSDGSTWQFQFSTDGDVVLIETVNLSCVPQDDGDENEYTGQDSQGENQDIIQTRWNTHRKVYFKGVKTSLGSFDIYFLNESVYTADLSHAAFVERSSGNLKPYNFQVVNLNKHTESYTIGVEVWNSNTGDMANNSKNYSILQPETFGGVCTKAAPLSIPVEANMGAVQGGGQWDDHKGHLKVLVSGGNKNGWYSVRATSTGKWVRADEDTPGFNIDFNSSTLTFTIK